MRAFQSRSARDSGAEKADLALVDEPRDLRVGPVVLEEVLGHVVADLDAHDLVAVVCADPLDLRFELLDSGVVTDLQRPEIAALEAVPYGDKLRDGGVGNCPCRHVGGEFSVAVVLAPVLPRERRHSVYHPGKNDRRPEPVHPQHVHLRGYGRYLRHSPPDRHDVHPEFVQTMDVLTREDVDRYHRRIVPGVRVCDGREQSRREYHRHNQTPDPHVDTPPSEMLGTRRARSADPGALVIDRYFRSVIFRNALSSLDASLAK
jgi:hypothetical protein